AIHHSTDRRGPFLARRRAPSELPALSLHDALPISRTLGAGDVIRVVREQNIQVAAGQVGQPPVPKGQDNLPGRHQDVLLAHHAEDRKSTRLNSSHSQISYAVFCLKKKSNDTTEPDR